MACIKEREAKTHKMEGLYEAFCYGVTKWTKTASFYNIDTWAFSYEYEHIPKVNVLKIPLQRAGYHLVFVVSITCEQKQVYRFHESNTPNQ
jgi:hypothetical protein